MFSAKAVFCINFSGKLLLIEQAFLKRPCALDFLSFKPVLNFYSWVANGRPPTEQSNPMEQSNNVGFLFLPHFQYVFGFALKLFCNVYRWGLKNQTVREPDVPSRTTFYRYNVQKLKHLRSLFFKHKLSKNTENKSRKRLKLDLSRTLLKIHKIYLNIQ